ncbi:methionine--tRNA ligase [Spirochaetota bacterium]
MSKKRKILVTAALPYANGDIHIGHLVEYLQTDFWVRFQKMRGHECRYMCADDTHGTPVMISSKELGISPEELIEREQKKHIRDFAAFEIEFDNYYTTNSPENRELSEDIYNHMKEKGHIESKVIKQFYCGHDSMFLPDRFVIGTCPRCGAEEQYGDSCDQCSATYDSFEIESPKCAVCGNKPVEKESEHLFFKLNNFRDYLLGWVKEHTSTEVVNKLNEWLKDDLRDWDISRDAPYFGFEIPGYTDKYFYVWLDAPIGYIASTMNWCAQNKRELSEFWRNGDGENELYHFIGKDIMYFHTLFWPVMLMNAGYKTPDQVFIHGFLTVNGKKMSKSKGTFIKACTYLDHLNPLYLRYYYACKMSPTMDDIDLNFNDFLNRVNSDLIGKITNLASRGAQMLNKLDSTIGALSKEGEKLVKEAQDKAELMEAHFEKREFSKAMIEIRNIADKANKYFDDAVPWKTIKTDENKTKEVLSAVLTLFRIMAVYLKPVLPSYTVRVEKLFNDKPYTWDSYKDTLKGKKIGTYEHLLTRIEKKGIDMAIEDSKEKTGLKAPGGSSKDGIASLAAEIDYDTFCKIDLRVAKVLEAEEIEGADKLLRLKIDVGTDERTILAGIKTKYTPDELIGRHIIVAANLQPRKMKFGTSEGMLLAAGDGGKDLYLLSIDDGAKPGQRIH